MKFAREPSCERAFDAPNWFVTITPMEPARLVTKAIMKNKANIMIIAGRFEFLVAIDFYF